MGNLSFGGSVNGIWNVGSWHLVVLVIAGVRYICDGMAIRWWTILCIITICVIGCTYTDFEICNTYMHPARLTMTPAFVLFTSR